MARGRHEYCPKCGAYVWAPKGFFSQHRQQDELDICPVVAMTAVEYLQAEWQECRRQRDELLALLQGLEWQDIDPDPARPPYGRCPICHVTTTVWDNGWTGEHYPTCELAAVIARARSGSGQAGEATD